MGSEDKASWIWRFDFTTPVPKDPPLRRRDAKYTAEQ